MASLGSLFGITGAGGSGTGGSGTSYQATNANVVQPVSQTDAQSADAQAQAAFTQQQAFLNALNNQGALNQQNNVLSQVNAQNGIGNQNAVFQQQQGLANQLQGMANGTGPNPAQAALNQNTGNNVATQAALMAGQRGAGANTGLIARQAAQQGAATQQQAVGQGATLQAQQQLGAIGALQNQQAALANSANTMTNNQLGLTQAQVAQQQAGLNSLNSQAQGLQANNLGQINSQNNANVAAQSSVNSANAGLANTVAGGQQKTVGGIINGVAGGLAAAHGGMVPGDLHKFADGGPVAGNASIVQNGPTIGGGPASKVGQMLAGTASSSPQDALQAGGQAIGTALGKGIGSLFSQGTGDQGLSAPDMGSEFSGSGYGLSSPAAGASAPGLGVDLSSLSSAAPVMEAKGGPIKKQSRGQKADKKVDALVSPGEVYLPPEKVAKISNQSGNKILSAGEKIPGTPKVMKDSYANDTVPKKLEAGGIVLPLHVTKAKNPGKEAEKFVNAVLAKQNMKRKA